MKSNQLINGDCLEVMSNIPDDSIDALITDPPYYTTHLKFDKESKINFELFFKEAHRICKSKAPVICFSQQPFTTDLIVANRKNYRVEWIWEKSLAMGFLNAKKRPLRAHENIVIFSEKGWHTYNPQKIRVHNKKKKVQKRNGYITRHYNQKQVDSVDDGTRYPRSVVKYRNVSKSWDKTAFHPTQKPLELLELLVKTYSNPGELIFDPFSGSAVTAIAAIRNNRKYLVVEKDPAFYELAKQRINAEFEAEVS